MELLVIVIIAFLIGKSFGKKKDRRHDDWPDEPVEYMPPKEKGCFSRLISVIFKLFVVIVLLTFITSLNGEDVETSTPATPPTVSSVEATPIPTAVSTPQPTAAPTAEPSTLQEWAEVVAQQVYGRFDYEYTNLISVSCHQVDGDPAPMVEVFVKYPDTFMRKNDDRMGSFLYNVMRITQKLDELADQGKIQYGSVLIHGRSMFMDNYGNEFEADAASIRIKAVEAAKVNWDNISSDMIPNIAVAFGMQPVIREGLSQSYYNSIKKK